MGNTSVFRRGAIARAIARRIVAERAGPRDNRHNLTVKSGAAEKENVYARKIRVRKIRASKISCQSGFWTRTSAVPLGRRVRADAQSLWPKYFSGRRQEGGRSSSRRSQEE